MTRTEAIVSVLVLSTDQDMIPAAYKTYAQAQYFEVNDELLLPNLQAFTQ